MSRRLAVSAAFSVLMMACYVLFGENAARFTLGPPSIVDVADSASITVERASASSLLEHLGGAARSLLDRR